MTKKGHKEEREQVQERVLKGQEEESGMKAVKSGNVE